jgi:hypothetical protein
MLFFSDCMGAELIFLALLASSKILVSRIKLNALVLTVSIIHEHII